MDEESRLVSQWAARHATEYQRQFFLEAVIEAARAMGDKDITIEELNRLPSMKEVKDNPQRYHIIGKVPPKPAVVQEWEDRVKKGLAGVGDREVVPQP